MYYFTGVVELALIKSGVQGNTDANVRNLLKNHFVFSFLFVLTFFFFFSFFLC